LIFSSVFVFVDVWTTESLWLITNETENKIILSAKHFWRFQFQTLFCLWHIRHTQRIKHRNLYELSNPIFDVWQNNNALSYIHCTSIISHRFVDTCDTHNIFWKPNFWISWLNLMTQTQLWDPPNQLEIPWQNRWLFLCNSLQILA